VPRVWQLCRLPFIMYLCLTSFPGLHAQLLSLAVWKAGRRPGRIYHVMRATADIMFSRLTSGFVFSPSLSLTWIQFVLSVQFVPRVQLLLDQSWLATVRDVSSGTHHMMNRSSPSPCFSYCKRQNLGIEAWERGYQLTTLRVVIPTKSLLVQRQSQ